MPWYILPWHAIGTATRAAIGIAQPGAHPNVDPFDVHINRYISIGLLASPIALPIEQADQKVY